MKHRVFGIVCGAAVAAFAAGIPAHAETLLMKRVREEHGMNVPHRGMTMNQVERRFGAPSAKLTPAGGDTPKHPVINRWEYPNYIVYFERNIVIDSVAVQASPGELGPKSQ